MALLSIGVSSLLVSEAYRPILEERHARACEFWEGGSDAQRFVQVSV